MFDILYYSPYVTCFSFGILFLIYNLGRIALFEIDKNDDYIRYFDDIKIEKEIFKFISNIFMVFFLYLFMALTNLYFSPNHVVVADVIANMLIFLLKSDSNIKYYAIIPFLFQILLLMIFLELIELNFCGLNKNTKRNIQIRARGDIEDIDNDDSLVEVSGYIVEENNKESYEKKQIFIEI